MAESGTAVLSMLVPLSAKWAEKPCPVEIRQTPAGHNPECVRVCSDYYPEVMFEQNDDVRVARLSFVPSPSSRVEVFVGVPCRVSTEALQEASSAGAERYTADFGGGSVVKNSAFAVLRSVRVPRRRATACFVVCPAYFCYYADCGNNSVGWHACRLVL